MRTTLLTAPGFALRSAIARFQAELRRPQNRTIPWLMGLAACSGFGGAADDWQPVSYVDSGEVCFRAGQNGDVVVTVTANVCLSSNCSREFVGSCSASVSGETVTLTSDLSWEENVATGVDCTADCGIAEAVCEIASLDEGTYTVVHGTEQYTLLSPVTEPCP